MVAGSNGNSVLVLYKVVNSGTDPDGGLYNAFAMPRGGGITLASVKKHCAALRTFNHAGADGFHWRVRVDDKAKPSSGGSKPPPDFSWWDIQDENAKLPIKEATNSELEHMFSPPKVHHTSTSSSETGGAHKAKGMLGKAMNAVAGTVDGSGTAGHHDHGPRVSVIAFKILDLVKLHDEYDRKHTGRRGERQPIQQQQQPSRPRPVPVSAPAAHPRPAPKQPQQQTTRTTQSEPNMGQAAAAPTRQQTPPQKTPKAPAPAKPSAPKQQEASLMDFGNEAPARTLQHTTSSPAAFSNETRAERLKREYEKKQNNANRVWDDVDQRWVEVDKKGGSTAGTTSAPPGASHAAPAKKTVGIKLDTANAVGKSAGVQAAVHKRVNEMKESQEKAVKEVREREMKKKESEAQEDEVRKRLEPKIKAWSEEHGKKKQLRALLSSLHTILWPGANWKPVSLGDILDANKCKRCYHKASRVVHPDKTHHLEPEQRFLAKRIFDALSQAKTEFDNAS